MSLLLFSIFLFLLNFCLSLFPLSLVYFFILNFFMFLSFLFHLAFAFNNPFFVLFLLLFCLRVSLFSFFIDTQIHFVSLPSLQFQKTIGLKRQFFCIDSIYFSEEKGKEKKKKNPLHAQLESFHTKDFPDRLFGLASK